MNNSFHRFRLIALIALPIWSISAQTPEVTTDPPQDESVEVEDPIDTSDEPAPAEEFIARALDAEERHDFKEAISACSKAIDADPDNPDYLAKRAGLLAEDRQINASLEDVARALELDPNHVRARLSRAITYQIQGDFDKALKDLNEAIERNQTSIEAYKQREQFYGRQGMRNEALADSDRIIQLGGDPVDGYLSRAEIHYHFGEHDAARQYASKVIEADPGNWLALHLRANCNIDQLHFSEALQDLEKASESAPNKSIIYLSKATVYAELGEFEKASGQFRQGLEIDPSDYLTRANFAAFLASCPDDTIRNSTEAQRLMAEAFQRSPNQPALWPFAAAVAAEKGDFEEAARWQQKYLQWEGVPAHERKDSEAKLQKYRSHEPLRFMPEGVVARLSSYSSKNHAGPHDFQQQLRDWQIATSAWPKDADVWNGLAWLLSTCPDDKIRDSGKAAEAIDQALEFQPDGAAIWDTCAAVFAENGMFQEAVLWEQAFVARTNITEAQRKRGAERLTLYRSNKPYRELSDAATSPTPSVAAPPPEK